MTYKETLEKINAIVTKIESGEPDVDELTDLISQALKLIQSCQNTLRDTEKSIEKSFQDDNNTA
jgi:exodeoxyribonuclease VII small subunit